MESLVTLPITKQELQTEIHKRYLLLQEYDSIPESYRNVRDDEVQRTPAEILAYQLGWIPLLIGWDQDEKSGKNVIMPKAGYKWNQLGEMYQSFYQDYQEYSLREMLELFEEREAALQNWINTLTDDELFTQGVRKWTGDNDNWPMIRWIKINTISPFTNFRTKIRKWKKNQLD